MAPSERIVMGAIGIGGRGSSDLGWMLGEPDVQFVAVCDVRKGNREAAKNAVDGRNGNKDCAAYRDMRELLAERTDIDAVLIATGDRWHAPASILAMRAGKDVYCEKPACLTMAQGQMVVETARRYGRVYQTGAQRLSEPNHVFAIEMARTGRLGQDSYRLRRHPLARRDAARLAAGGTGTAQGGTGLGCLARPLPLAAIQQRLIVNGGGWYHYYDFATDVAMWGAHTVAQALAGLDMTNVSYIELEYEGPDATMMTRLSNGVKLVLFRSGGSVSGQCEFWHGSCGERFDGPEGWVAAADGYSGARCLIAGAVARVQESAGGLHGPDPAAVEPRAGFPRLRPVAPTHGGESRGHVSVHDHLPGCRHLRAIEAKPEVRSAQG